MEKESKIFVAGHRGMVGSAITRKLQDSGYSNLLLKSRQELDLCDQKAVSLFFKKERPEYLFLAAAKVGGIHANNTYPAEFIYENLMIESNLIHSSYENPVKKLLFLGSSCIYPRLAEQPIREESLLSGYLEPTNEAYAIAKIAGIKICQSYRKQYGCDFITAMPTNLYGEGDNFDLETSHVLPALMRKFHEAKREGKKEVTLWGTGTPRREFLHADDLADAALFLMKNYSDSSPVNIGTGEDLEIRELAKMIQECTGFEGKIVYDKSKPDGTARKLLDVSKLHGLGWKHSLELKEGVKKVYEWYVQHTT